MEIGEPHFDQNGVFSPKRQKWYQQFVPIKKKKFRHFGTKSAFSSVTGDINTAFRYMSKNADEKATFGFETSKILILTKGKERLIFAIILFNHSFLIIN